MNFYGASVREVLPGAKGSVLVRFWPPSPHPRIYVLNAFAKAIDAVVVRKHGPMCCAAIYRPHPEAAVNAIDIVLPQSEADPRAAAQECIAAAAKECRSFMLEYHEALLRSM